MGLFSNYSNIFRDQKLNVSYIYNIVIKLFSYISYEEKKTLQINDKVFFIMF